MSNDTITKICSTCKEPKEVSEFHKDRTHVSGLRRQCKVCRKIISHLCRQTETGKASLRRYRQSDKGKAAKKRARQSAKGKVSDRRYRKSEKGKATMAKHRQQYPERIQANIAVNIAVKAGKLAPIKTQQCADCGQPARHYHHFLGYATKHHLDVIHLCCQCHRKRHY